MTDPSAFSVHRRLARPVAEAAQRYQALVVGSGYGAGVAVNRLARAGVEVAVLERGVERIPGEFPDSLTQAAREFQVSRGARHVGNHQGLFDMRVQADVSVLLGCGLGGTSLINGNVMLKPEPAVLQAADWARVLRDDTDGSLAASYDIALAMLESTPWPDTVTLQKLQVLELQAQGLGANVERPPINVTFAPRAETHGARQPACTLCGDCCSGCNVGAKNTIAMNYLADACDHGAQCFTGADVQWIERCETGWRVHLRNHNADQPGPSNIECEQLFLGAGTLGSTEILLRSAEHGLALSDQLGEGFSGNGDVLAFGYNNDVHVNGIGFGHPAREGVPPVGPVIAGLIDLRNQGDLSRNMVIQEGALPSPLAPLVPAMFATASPMFGTDTDYGDSMSELGRTLSSLARGAYKGAVANTQTFLVMAHEASRGRMQLADDALQIHWPDAGRDPVFKHISDTLQQATAATGGTYIPNPVWSKALGRNLISVHPLGGCAIGESAASGVVDDCGRVFSGNAGIHAGLHVLDGSIVPSSLGVNPSLTITALAERAMAKLLPAN